jgi:hypothetical protein
MPHRDGFKQFGPATTIVWFSSATDFAEGQSFSRTPKTQHLAGQNNFLKIPPNNHFPKIRKPL